MKLRLLLITLACSPILISSFYVSDSMPEECEYKKSIFKPPCHICGKRDMVVPIIYGYGTDELFKRYKEGKVEIGGCIIRDCQPKWHCKRDNEGIKNKRHHNNR